MKKYMVGVLNFFDNENKLYQVEAENGVKAIQQALIKDCGDSEDTIKSYHKWFELWDEALSVEDVLSMLVDNEYAITPPAEIGEVDG